MDNVDNKNSPSPDYSFSPRELPTTPDIAIDGVRLLKEIFDRLPSNKLKFAFVRDPAVLACLTGVTPERIAIFYEYDGNESKDSGGLELSDSEINQLEGGVRDTTDKIVIHSSAQVSTHENGYFSLINVAAAKYVIQNNPSYFPQEAQEDTRRWLTEHKDEWWGGNNPGNENIEDIRAGLLSGFPLWSVKAYPILDQAISRLKGLLTNEEMNKVLYYRRNYAKTDQTDQEIRKILLGVPSAVSSEEINLILKTTAIMRPDFRSIISYTGFDPQRDFAYANALKELFIKSGIYKVASTLISTISP